MTAVARCSALASLALLLWSTQLRAEAVPNTSGAVPGPSSPVRTGSAANAASTVPTSGSPATAARRRGRAGKQSPTPSGRTADPDAVRRLLRRLQRSEPTLAEVRRAAVLAAGLDGQREGAWSRRARQAGLLPELSVRFTHGRGDDRDVSRSSTGSERRDVGWDRDIDVEVRAVWKLDRLVFDDVEMRVRQAAQRAYRERVQLLAQVTSVYFQRRKLQLAALASSPGDTGKAVLHALAVAELTGQLDALTGGYFSRQVTADSPRR